MRRKEKGKLMMARFLIFVGVFIILLVAGIVVWWIGSNVYLSIKRKQAQFSVEESTYEEAKDQILEGMRKEKKEW